MSLCRWRDGLLGGGRVGRRHDQAGLALGVLLLMLLGLATVVKRVGRVDERGLGGQTGLAVQGGRGRRWGWTPFVAVAVILLGLVVALVVDGLVGVDAGRVMSAASRSRMVVMDSSQLTFGTMVANHANHRPRLGVMVEAAVAVLEPLIRPRLPEAAAASTSVTSAAAGPTAPRAH